MDIVTRLKLFLDQAGISNSQFADTCDIPRPTLSQLLNGRNKKVSDEVIGKIHRAYPTLNIMWLMFGDGEMLAPGSSSQSGDSGMGEADYNQDKQRNQDKGQRSISFDVDGMNSGFVESTAKQQRMSLGNKGMPETMLSMMRRADMRSPKTSNPAGEGDEVRRVTDIFVFYNDGRYERFQLSPKKDNWIIM